MMSLTAPIALSSSRSKVSSLMYDLLIVKDAVFLVTKCLLLTEVQWALGC